MESFKLIYIYYTSIIVFWCIVIIKIFTSTMGINATDTSYINRYMVSVLVPEGWGFFTRNPREFQFDMKLIDSKNNRMVTVKNTDQHNWFGLSRKSRRINLEFQRILSKLPDSVWINNIHKVSYFKLSEFNDQLIYIKPGKYMIRKFAPVPWAWAKYPMNFSQEKDSVNIIIQ